MASSPFPTNQEGPSESPPSLPEGWLAQWEGQSRKYYYVQRATGHSQWEIPTQPAPSVPTPDPTPQQTTDPFQRPANVSGNELGQGANTATRPGDGTVDDYQGADRSFLGDLAMNAVTGGKHNKPQKQSGFGGIASSLLGGQGGGSHQGGGGGGLAGQLVGSLLGGGKPHNQNQSSHHSGSSGGYGESGGSTSGAHNQGGLLGMASGFLGGHHGSTDQSNNYGYTSSGQGSGSSGYSGQAPPASYQPPGQQSSNQYGSSSAQHNLQTQSNDSHNPNYGDSSGFSQGSHGGLAPIHHEPGIQGSAYGHQNHPSTGSSSTQVYPPSGGYGQPPNTFPGPPQGQYGSSTSSTPAYGQPPSSYASHNQEPNYNAYPGPNQQHQYPPPPPPPQNPSYGGQQTGYNSYSSPPPVSSPHVDYQKPPSGAGYPGQQGNYHHTNQGGPNYGQSPPPPQSGGYGPQGGYGGSSAPPVPGWRI